VIAIVIPGNDGRSQVVAGDMTCERVAKRNINLAITMAYS
jgi:hypothetical protein